MESVLELTYIIGQAANCDGFLIAGLDDAVALNDLPNAITVLGKGSVLSVNLTSIGDLKGLALVVQHGDLAKVKLGLIEFD